MRFILTSLVVFLCAPSSLAAQQSSGPTRLAVGIEAGLALATLSSYQTPDVDEAFDTGIRQGLIVGAFFELRLRDGLSFRPEIYVVQKGSVLRFADAGGADSATVDIRYVELATLFRLSPSRESARPFVNVGPTVAFKTSANVDASASGGPSNVDVGSQVRTADVGIAIGGGIQRGRWCLEARIVQGIIDIGNTRQVDDVVRTRTASFLAGFRF
jgi:hypothetical protein